MKTKESEIERKRITLWRSKYETQQIWKDGVEVDIGMEVWMAALAKKIKGKVVEKEGKDDIIAVIKEV